ncbi:MAG: nuclear transport factor 2 family protein [Clostridium sp.]|uniref:nuclear transport factor 2 family protein n=1 Tax=Clostridium sp. TaxID=1506 RepID=UPI003EE710E3
MENKIINKREKHVKAIAVIVLIVAIVAGGTYVVKNVFFSSPEQVIRNFYGAISNNELQKCLTYTDIQDRLDAQVPNEQDREQIMQTFLKQFNINERKIHIKLIDIKKESGDSETAVYDVKYDINITYKTGPAYNNTEADRIYLTKIRGQWKIVNSNGMYDALSNIMDGVIQGQNSVLEGIK